MRSPVAGSRVMTRNYTAISLKEQKKPTLSLEPRDFDTGFPQNQRHEARTTPSPALCQRALITTRNAPRCLPLHPDRVGVRHRCRARETSSRASRADITSSAASIATGNDVPHAKRHLCPSKHASRGSPSSRSNPTLAQAGNQAHRPHHVASQSSAVGALSRSVALALALSLSRSLSLSLALSCERIVLVLCLFEPDPQNLEHWGHADEAPYCTSPKRS